MPLQWCASRQLWFDVEQRYKTMGLALYEMNGTLWFDVEQRYKTMQPAVCSPEGELWFDVEQR